jgi:hypothetical protein
MKGRQKAGGSIGSTRNKRELARRIWVGTEPFVEK